MEESKVGEYVRDKYGEIHIVYKVEKDTVYCDKPKMENPPFDTYGCRYYENRADIVKHSEFIGELIEIGDYVNGFIVEDKWEDADHIRLASCEYYESITDDEIKTVITKEQLKKMEYRIGD